MPDIKSVLPFAAVGSRKQGRDRIIVRVDRFAA